MPRARSARAVFTASEASVAGCGYWEAGGRPAASVGSPPPTRITEDGAGPVTTRVVKRVAGPSTCSAAVATASFAVEAGAKPEAPWRESSTWPDDRSVTTAPTCEPSAAEPSGPDSAAVTPAAVASRLADPAWTVPAAGSGTGLSTGPAPASRCAATVGSRHSASRAGSR